jgi:hypothetical protein
MRYLAALLLAVLAAGGFAFGVSLLRSRDHQGWRLRVTPKPGTSSARMHGSGGAARPPRVRHPRWGAAAATAGVGAIAFAWHLVGLYSYPDRPDSPGWLAVYAETTEQCGDKRCIKPFSVPTYEAILTARRDGNTFRGRFSVSAPHIKAGETENAVPQYASVMLVAGGPLSVDPSFRPVPDSEWAAYLGIELPRRPQQTDVLQVHAVYRNSTIDGRRSPLLRAVKCELTDPKQVCAADISWPASFTEANTFQRRIVRLPVVQPPTLPGLRNKTGTDWSVYPLLRTLDTTAYLARVPGITGQVKVTASLRSQEDMLRLRVDTGFPAVAISGEGFRWAGEVATPHSPVEPQALLVDPGKERWAQAALVTAGALLAVAIALIWAAARWCFGWSPPK